MTQHSFVGSNNISSFDHDEAASTLLVTFSSGKTYRYGGVTAADIAGWTTAESAGKWFNANIKAHPKRFPVIPEKAPTSSATDASRPAGAVRQVEAGAPVEEKPATFDHETADGEPRSEQHECPELYDSTPGAPPIQCHTQPVAVVERSRRRYEGYIANSGGKSHDGRQCPPWELLGAAVQSHWCAAELAVPSGGEGDPHSALAIESANVARLSRALEEERAKMQKVEEKGAYLTQEAIDRAAAARTKMLEDEVDTLRAQVTSLQASAISKPALEMPWKRGRD